MTRLVISPKARDQLLRIGRRIAIEQPSAEERFLSAFVKLCDQLRYTPRIGVARDFGRTELRDVRMMPLRSFTNYLVLYRVNEDASVVEIWAVVDGRRDLGALLGDSSE